MKTADFCRFSSCLVQRKSAAAAAHRYVLITAGMKDQIACVALIFGMAALCNMASIAVVQLIQATGVIA